MATRKNTRTTARVNRVVAAANQRGRKIAPKGGIVTKEQVQAGWAHLSKAEQAGFRKMGWAPTGQPTRGRRTMAQENPPASRTVKGNGNGGNGGTTPELTDAQRTELADAKASVPTLTELLTQRLQGVGKQTAEAALADAELDGSKKASKAQRERANAAPTEKAGLRGKSLALWVLTGKSNGGKNAEPAEAPISAKARTAALEGAAGQQLLVEYLNAQVSGDALAPAENKPTVDENGKLRIKSAHWRGWLASKGVEVGNAAAVKVLRGAGLDQERWFSLPRGQRMCYVGAVPNGTKKLPVRKDAPLPGATAPRQRGGAGSTRVRFSVEQIDVITAALNAFKPRGADKAQTEQMRDEVLQLLKA